MYVKTLLFLLSIGLFMITSCSNKQVCHEVNLGKVLRIDEDAVVLELRNIDSLIYIDQDSNLIYLPVIGDRIDVHDKMIRFKCIEDGNFYTAKYQIESTQTSFSLDLDDKYFTIVKRAELPLKSNIEPNGLNARSIIENQFANQTVLYVYNNLGSSLKLSLFTKTENTEIVLSDINEFNNSQLEFFESIELNGKEFQNVYRTKKNDLEGSEIFYSQSKGLIRFSDRMNNVLTLDSIIYY